MTRWQVPVVLAAVAIGTALGLVVAVALVVGPLIELPVLALVANRLLNTQPSPSIP
jgi:ACR3 family arsenite efflux pump ArsB